MCDMKRKGYEKEDQRINKALLLCYLFYFKI